MVTIWLKPKKTADNIFAEVCNSAIALLNGIMNCRDSNAEKDRFLPMPDNVSVGSILNNGQG